MARESLNNEFVENILSYNESSKEHVKLNNFLKNNMKLKYEKN